MFGLLLDISMLAMFWQLTRIENCMKNQFQMFPLLIQVFLRESSCYFMALVLFEGLAVVCELEYAFLWCSLENFGQGSSPLHF